MERFMILARQAGDASERLSQILQPMGSVTVITDIPAIPFSGRLRPPHIWISDEEAAGFGGIMSGNFPRMNTWSRAMAYLAKIDIEDDSVWFVEDDVAGDVGSFRALVYGTASADPDLAAIELRTRTEDPSWYHWSLGAHYFNEPCRGFVPLCRLSAPLLKRVFEFQQRQGSCAFMEIMFPSIARQYNMTWLDWRVDFELRNYLGIFHYRPEVSSPIVGVSHPVKDPAIHKAICELPSDPSQQSKSEVLKRWFGEPDIPIRVLETGADAGIQMQTILTICAHPESEAHFIESAYNSENFAKRAAFDKRDINKYLLSKSFFYEGLTQEILAWMIASDGYWESFDYIELNDTCQPGDILADCCQAWSLIKPGGMLLFDSKLRHDLEKKAAVKAFIRANKNRLRILRDDDDLWIIIKRSLITSSCAYNPS